MKKILLLIACFTIGISPVIYADSEKSKDTTVSTMLLVFKHGDLFLDAVEDFLKSDKEALGEKENAELDKNKNECLEKLKRHNKMFLNVLEEPKNWQVNKQNRQTIIKNLNFCEAVKKEAWEVFSHYYTRLVLTVNLVGAKECEKTDKYLTQIVEALKKGGNIDEIIAERNKDKELIKIRKAKEILSEFYNSVEKITQDFETQYNAKLTSVKKKFGIKETKSE